MTTTHIAETIRGKVLEIHLTGQLTSEDYARFVPDADELIRLHGKIRVLAIFDDFRGWDAGAVWQDIKWNLRHFSDIERVAMVGEKSWHHAMAIFCKPFTAAKIRYFDHAQEAEARAWVDGL